MFWKGGDGGWGDALEEGFGARAGEVVLDPEIVSLEFHFGRVLLPTYVRHQISWPFLVSSYASRRCSGRCTAPASNSRQMARTWRHACCEAHTAQSCPIAPSRRLTMHIGLGVVFVARACGVVKLDLKVAVPCLVLFEHDLISVMRVQHHLLPVAALRQPLSRPLCVKGRGSLLRRVLAAVGHFICYDGSGSPACG